MAVSIPNDDPIAKFEALAFQTLNAVVEPLVRAGLGGPLLTPFGAIVLEVPGRTSGTIRRNPLLASVFGSTIVVATYRGRRSAWVKNLAARREAAWWVNGVRKEGEVVVFGPEGEWPAAARIPEALRLCAESWRALVGAGWAIAVLSQRPD